MQEYKVIFQTLEKVFGTGKQNYNSTKPFEVLFYCPKCQHHKRKLAINLKTRKMHCWVCNLRSKNYLDFISENGYGSDIREQLEKLLQDLSLYGEIEVPDIKTDSYNDKLTLPKDYKYFYNPTAKYELNYNSVKNYLIKERNITRDDVELLQLGFSIFDKKAIIPSYDIYEELNYYISRNIDKESYIKYENPNVEKTSIVFNEHLLDWDIKDIYVVEGAFDFMKLNYQNCNIVLSLGSHITENTKLFNTILMFNNIYICYDRDAIKKSISLAGMFYKYGKEAYILDWRQVALKEVNDLGGLIYRIENPKELEYKKYHGLIGVEVNNV